mgnify:CR=1 FL=1
MSPNNSEKVNSVPLLDLKAQYQSIRNEILPVVERVLESQYFILGPEVEGLEQEVAEYCGSQFAVGVSSGTDALLASLMAFSIGPGDEVITTPFTFFATVGSILRLGATPVFVDIDRDTYNIDTAKIARKITTRTKAIMPVHLFGQSVDMDPVMELAKKYGLAVIEDAAQAIGSEYMGSRIGSIGNVGCFSFFPSKNLGGFGDGGMITTNDPATAELLRQLRNQGSAIRYFHDILGANFRLDALQAAILRIKLRHLDSWTDKRRANAAYYTKRLQETGVAPKYVTPPKVIFERHVFNQYVIRAKNRDSLKNFLLDNKIVTEIYYPKPMHLQECLGKHKMDLGSFPVSETAAGEVLALPIYPELTLDQKEHVIKTIQEFYVG